MRFIRQMTFAALVVAFGGATLQAADVTVKGVHLCCGSCVKDAQGALSSVEGISGVGADQNTKVIAFKAANDEAVGEALAALAEAGFHGTVTVDKKEVPFPSPKLEKGAKSNSITVTGVHLCCGACVTGVKKGLENVAGVDEMKIDRQAKTVTVSGKDIDVGEFFAALFAAGYHGEPKK